MYPNKVEICGINTSSLPVMKDVQMDEMIEKIRSGDTGLREKFITGNLRLVLSVIQKVPKQRREYGRLVSGGLYRSDQGPGQF